MIVKPLEIPDVKLIVPKVYGDSRGFFLETWNSSVFDELGIRAEFVQDNWSRSGRGVLRGLHYQLERAQGKLVRCTRGEIFDVAVDLRKSSPTFGRWVGAVLSGENKLALWLPPGFAHGFLTLSSLADFHYKCTDLYHPASERTIRWDDPELGIDWPIDPLVSVRLSDRDRLGGVGFSDAEVFA